jgi:hypothetical protein
VGAMEPESVVSWETGPAVALSFTVNFGVFAGREVSRRELERLGEILLSLVDEASVTAESRFRFGQTSAASLHQVRVEIDPDALPPGEDVEGLRVRIAAELSAWFQTSLTAVSGQELTSAEIAARDAVVDLRDPRD